MLPKNLRHIYQTHPGVARFLRGIFASGLGNIINMLTRIILPPLFIYAWGVHVYGNWLLLASLVTYLTISSMGGQLYIVNRLTQLYNTGKYGEFTQVFNSGLFLLISIGIFILILFSVLVFILAPSHILKIDYISPDMTRWVLIILAFQFLSSMPQGLLTGTFQSIGQLPTGVMLNNCMLAGQVSLPALALMLHAPPVIIAIAQVLPVLFIISLASAMLKKRLPEYHLLNYRFAKFTKIKTFIKPSLHFLLIQVSFALSVEGLIIITGLTLGPVQVVIFATMRTLVNMMKQSLALVVNTAWPDLTRLDAQHNIKRLTQVFRFVMRTVLVAAFIIVIVLHFLGATIYHIWLHHKVPYNSAVMSWFLIYGLELVFWSTAGNLLMAINKHYHIAYVYLTSACLTVLFAYIGSIHFGIHGVVIGMLSADLLLPFWLIPYLVYRCYHVFNLKFYLLELTPIIICLAFVYITPWFCLAALPYLLLWWSCSVKLKIESS